MSVSKPWLCARREARPHQVINYGKTNSNLVTNHEPKIAVSSLCKQLIVLKFWQKCEALFIDYHSLLVIFFRLKTVTDRSIFSTSRTIRNPLASFSCESF